MRQCARVREGRRERNNLVVPDPILVFETFDRVPFRHRLAPRAVIDRRRRSWSSELSQREGGEHRSQKIQTHQRPGRDQKEVAYDRSAASRAVLQYDGNHIQSLQPTFFSFHKFQAQGVDSVELEITSRYPKERSSLSRQRAETKGSAVTSARHAKSAPSSTKRR